MKQKATSAAVLSQTAVPENGGAVTMDNSTFKLSAATEFHLPDLAISGTGRVYSVAGTTGSFKDVTKEGSERFTWGTKRKPLTEKQRVEVLKRLSQGEDIWQQLRDSFTFDEDALRAELEELLKTERQRA